ncbi:hypothetical protein QBC47DRAFT_406426 [Echria macrotheca]|uniref:CFEM domain-containing protein n=1 Tax=Echria macrotheca TaxID=438768 RepID=A0AAJ0F7G6_9PEZI|nr:hypothetical protein QBC47DRAFT_406426 [Echria macrotheca]
MRSTILAFVSLAATAWSQITEAPVDAAAPTATASISCSLTSLMPSCGISCIAAAASAVGCTSPMDFSCQCSHAMAMQSAVMPCVASACGAAAATVGSVANAICTACVATPTMVATKAGM